MSSLTFHSSYTHRGLRAAVIGWWTGLAEDWRSRQADRALQGFSDAMLHDIGVARGAIPEVTRHGRSLRG